MFLVITYRAGVYRMVRRVFGDAASCVHLALELEGTIYPLETIQDRFIVADYGECFYRLAIKPSAYPVALNGGSR